MQFVTCVHWEQPVRSLTADGAHFLQLFGISPDIEEPLLPYVAASKRKLDAGIKSP